VQWLGSRRVGAIRGEEKMLKKAIALVVPAVAVLMVCSAASADSDDRRAGTDGHLTAWTPGREVIDVDPCPRMGSTWAYGSCGPRFRVKVNAQLCRKNGKGNHKWLYQVGDSRIFSNQTARCN
jgi:hypothetical protein